MNDEGFRSLEGKSKHQLWLELCDLVTKHPHDVQVCGAGGWVHGWVLAWVAAWWGGVRGRSAAALGWRARPQPPS